jgi:hypothetical protein
MFDRRLPVVVCAAISVAAFLCAERAAAQVVVGTVISAPDVTQPVAGDCANYNSVLSTTGVSVNGQTHPGVCRSTVLTPLFDGVPLGTNMQAFLNSTAHRPLFTVKLTGQRARFCATASKLRVTISASLQATRLEWTGAPVIGMKCTDEVARVNAVSTTPTPAMAGLVSSVLIRAGKELRDAPQLTGCGRGSARATVALDQQVWNLLQRVASEEVMHFATSPASNVSSSCPAKCNLCFSGWVGSIQCTARANDPTYQ